VKPINSMEPMTPIEPVPPSSDYSQLRFFGNKSGLPSPLMETYPKLTIVCNKDFVITKYHGSDHLLLGWGPEDLENRRSIFDLCHAVDNRALYHNIINHEQKGNNNPAGEVIHFITKSGQYKRCAIEDVIDAGYVYVVTVRPMVEPAVHLPTPTTLPGGKRRSIGVQDLIEVSEQK